MPGGNRLLVGAGVHVGLANRAGLTPRRLAAVRLGTLRLYSPFMAACAVPVRILRLSRFRGVRCGRPGPTPHSLAGYQRWMDSTPSDAWTPRAEPRFSAHVAVRHLLNSDQLAGSLVVLFDVDEHTGNFGGARAHFADLGAPVRLDRVMIGYPGPDQVVTGAPGVLRAVLDVHGLAGHSGPRTITPNAITKAAALVSSLAVAELPASGGPDFPLPPRLTVTEISGGSGYSAVPDLCTLHVDVRLTPSFGAAAAESLLRAQVADVDASWPATRPTHVG